MEVAAGSLGGVGVTVVLPGEEPALERRVRADREILIGANVEELPDGVAVGGVEPRLGHLEPFEAVHVARPQRLRQLPGRHRGGAQVVHLPLFDEAGERPEGLPDRRLVVPAVDVVEVDVVGVEPVERPFDLRSNVLAREILVELALHRPIHLAGDHDVLAFVVVEPLADPAFALAAAVAIGGVNEVDPVVPRRVEQVVCLLAGRLDGSVFRLEAEPPRPEAELGHLCPGRTKRLVVHSIHPFSLHLFISVRFARCLPIRFR